MALEFCLPEVGTGSVADWAAVLVAAWAAAIAALAAVIGIAGASATVWVGLLAHRTSKRATEIADRAAQIAQQQHGEAVKLREETARIIGRLLLAEVGSVPARAARIVRNMRRVVEPGADYSTLTGVENFDRAMFEAGQDLLPTAQHVLDKIHNLPDALGADLATFIAACMSLRTMGDRVEAKVVRISLDTLAGEQTIIKLKDGPGDFLIMLGQALWIVRHGALFANEFQAFVGVSPNDYSGYISEFEGM